MKNAAKLRLVIISAVLGLILLTFAALGLVYLYTDSVVFAHRDTSSVPMRVDIDAPSPEEYPVNYPWFGNPMMIPSHDSGMIYAIPFGSAGVKNLDVYDAVNDPIVMWIYYLGERYDRRFTLDYTMEQDSKRIAVYFTGTAEDDDGSTVRLDQSFLYDIENAGPDKLPIWLNEEDMSEECKEYWDFLLHYETVPMPAWLEEKLAAEAEEAEE